MPKLICIQFGTTIWQGTEFEHRNHLGGRGTPIPSYRRPSPAVNAGEGIPSQPSPAPIEALINE